MINTGEILQTIDMISNQHLDVRTITMGISLRDCAREDSRRCRDAVYDKITKSAKMIQKAYGGYKEINLRAMRLLNPSGILVSCSCSAYFDETTFYSMLSHAASDSHRKVQVLEKRGAGPDHPVLLGYPKSAYLKCAICRVM